MKKVISLLVALLVLTVSCAAFADSSTVWVGSLHFSSDAEEIDLTGERMSADDLIAALQQFTDLKTVYMWDWPVSRDDKVALHEAFPDVFFGIEMTLSETSTLRTDAEVYSVKGEGTIVTNWNLINFALCKDLKALDLTACTLLDVSALSECTQLKILNLGNTCITDIACLSELTELEYLELYLNGITDISALAQLTNLKDVNLAYNDITDLSPLYNLPNLERVSLMGNFSLTEQDVYELQQHQPDCQIVTSSDGATGNLTHKEYDQLVETEDTGWYDHQRGEAVREIFSTGSYTALQ